jgi:ubiquinone/menaquinone biosynthesis C-methylase UbiE
MRTLTSSEAKKFYDWLGSKQDSQHFYEDKAIEVLIETGEFHRVQTIYEFGCGTGRLAELLLEKHLQSNTEYYAVDISTTMVALTRRRLEKFGKRVHVMQTQGEVQTQFKENNFDRFISTYVLDLLGEEQIIAVIGEAHRVLKAGGLLVLASLSYGERIFPRLITTVWKAVYRINPRLVGGCRPLELSDYLLSNEWKIKSNQKLSQFGITSEILVAEKVAV